MMYLKEAIKEFLHRFAVGTVGFGDIPSNIKPLEIEEQFPKLIVFGYPISQ